MPVPFVKMCTARCKKISTVTAMSITAFLVLYALISLGGDDEKYETPKEVVLTKSGDSALHVEPLEILEKVKEIIEAEVLGTLKTDTKDDDDVELNENLFENIATVEDSVKETQEVIGCDACGETLVDVDIPFEMTTRKLMDQELSTEAIDELDFEEESVGNETRVLTPEEKEIRRQERANRLKARAEEKARREAYRREAMYNRTLARTAERRRLELISNITRVQNKRKLRMEHSCRSSLYLKYQNLLYKDTLRHLFVVDSQKLLFCYIPKVGCSNWKRILMVLAGRRNSMSEISSREAHSRNGLTRFGQLSMAEQFQTLKTYRKVMFVREPFTRIISAYKNKYKDMSVFRQAPEYLKQFARRIMRKYRPGATQHDLMTGENITWEEFTDYLADPAERPQFDEHWKESYKLCSPCKIKYDFIGKLENIEVEANYILHNSNFTMNLTYPSSTNSHPTNSASANISHLFTGFSKEKLQALWNIYRIDYALFDYEKPSFVPS